MELTVRRRAPAHFRTPAACPHHTASKVNPELTKLEERRHVRNMICGFEVVVGTDMASYVLEIPWAWS